MSTNQGASGPSILNDVVVERNGAPWRFIANWVRFDVARTRHDYDSIESLAYSLDKLRTRYGYENVAIDAPHQGPRVRPEEIADLIGVYVLESAYQGRR